MNTRDHARSGLRALRFAVAATCLASVIAFSNGSHAQKFGSELSFYSPQALELLPPYCRYTQLYRDEVPGANDPARIKYWYGVLGAEFHHLHHYCWALTHANNATFAGKITTARRQTLLTHAIREINYVIRNSSPRFVLAPELLTKRGEWHARLDNHALAIPDFARAIEVKPDYWPAYASMADMYKRAGEPAKAREWLEKGLAQVPDSKALRQKLAELGGAAGRPAPRSEKAGDSRPAEKPALPAEEKPATGEPSSSRPE